LLPNKKKKKKKDIALLIVFERGEKKHIREKSKNRIFVNILVFFKISLLILISKEIIIVN
jgi:hypothetical protein